MSVPIPRGSLRAYHGGLARCQPSRKYLTGKAFSVPGEGLWIVVQNVLILLASQFLHC